MFDNLVLVMGVADSSLRYMYVEDRKKKHQVPGINRAGAREEAKKQLLAGGCRSKFHGVC